MQEALELIIGEDEDMPNNIDLFIAPPDPSTLTDEDSAGEDEGGLIDNLSGRQLMASAEIRLPNNIVVRNLPTTSSNESTMPGPSFKISTAGPQKRNSPSITSPDVSNVGRTDTVQDMEDANGDTTLASTKINIIQNLILEKSSEVDAKKKNKVIDKNWVKGDFEPNNNTFPQPNFSRYIDFSASELFELFFDEEIFEILVRETERYALEKNGENPRIQKMS